MMKLRQGFKRAAAAALGLLLCAVCLTRPAGAVINRNIPVISGEPCSLTLDFKDPGVTFHLYRVASVSAGVRYTLLPMFSNDPYFPQVMDFNNITKASQWADLATTLRPYLERYYSPMRTVTTNRNGVAVFDDLPVGLYLVSGDPYSVTKANGEIRDYQPSSYFVCLPYWTDQSGGGEEWVYDLVVNGAKKDEIPHEAVSRRVIKIWSAGTRKEPVIVDLLRNGQVVDTVELSSRNNWRYEWTDLEPGSAGRFWNGPGPTRSAFPRPAGPTGLSTPTRFRPRRTGTTTHPAQRPPPRPLRRTFPWRTRRCPWIKRPTWTRTTIPTRLR